jgi:hypothetical protein
MLNRTRLHSAWRSASGVGKPAALAFLALCWSGAAAGGDLNFSEFWPEINAYYPIDERSRLLFTAAATRAMEGALEDRVTTLQDGQFTINFDYTLAPVLRKDVPQAEWSKNRLLWTRLGFDYGTSFTSGSDAFRSYTGVVELTSRYPIGEDVWLHNRLRVDFRHINGEPSQRYRARVGAEGAAVAFEHPYSPYANVELLYDTRYDKWSRTTFKTGLETPLAEDWRVEPYIALQLNKPGEEVNRVLGFGLTLKYYFR